MNVVVLQRFSRMAESLVDAVGGDELRALTALRDRLAVEIDGSASPRDVAALSRQFVDVLERIAAIKPAEKSKVDDLADKRAKRRGSAGGSDSADSGESAG